MRFCAAQQLHLVATAAAPLLDIAPHRAEPLDARPVEEEESPGLGAVVIRRPARRLDRLTYGAMIGVDIRPEAALRDRPTPPEERDDVARHGSVTYSSSPSASTGKRASGFTAGSVGRPVSRSKRAPW